jgi:tRNA (Thr-GGU) A37 N-methylase
MARGTTLDVEDVDILDGTPLLDLKPYVPAFDSRSYDAAGWLEHVANGAESVRSDKWFR